MKTLIALLLILPVFALAHGEDKPGPHGGHIQMPGAFHTELLIGKDGSAHIYLLDMEFKNPTTKDSQVTVTAQNKKSEVKFDCSIMGGNHYHCVPKKPVAKSSKLIIKAVREKVAANEATYQLPLKPLQTKAEKKTEDPHHNHH